MNDDIKNCESKDRTFFVNNFVRRLPFNLKFNLHYLAKTFSDTSQITNTIRWDEYCLGTVKILRTAKFWDILLIMTLGILKMTAEN